MPEELDLADEVFITGTAAEVTPIAEIGEHRFHVGEISRTLMDDYQTLVNSGGAVDAAAVAAE